ncbi:MAG TPA: hypothetical protein VHE09_14615 [Rhizomicrobium sp.]|jgi:hypothetical protein|nr:hypothetical protein [Rhizomicrobium sp.]
MTDEPTIQWLRDDVAKMEAEVANLRLTPTTSDPSIHRQIERIEQFISDRKKQIILRTS